MYRRDGILPEWGISTPVSGKCNMDDEENDEEDGLWDLFWSVGGQGDSALIS